MAHLTKFGLDLTTRFYNGEMTKKHNNTGKRGHPFGSSWKTPGPAK